MKSPIPAPAAQVAISIEAALRQIIEADDAHALTQQLIDIGRAALARPVAQSEPILAWRQRRDLNRATLRDAGMDDRGLPISSYMEAEITELRAALASRAPASGAPELQWAKCWSCKRSYTAAQRAEADGDCPFCGVEIEVDDTDYAAMAVAAPVAASGEVADLSQLARYKVVTGAGAFGDENYLTLADDGDLVVLAEVKSLLFSVGTPAIPPAPAEPVSEDKRDAERFRAISTVVMMDDSAEFRIDPDSYYCFDTTALAFAAFADSLVDRLAATPPTTKESA